MTNISVITTTKHNVGDDFVREGIVYLLRQVLGAIKLELIHKHLPITTRPELAWLHSSGIAQKLIGPQPRFMLRGTQLLDELLPIFPWSDKLYKCDILIQSGAPVYWLHPDNDCAHNEWWNPLIERRWLKNRPRKLFLNLAGGACQRWDSDGREFAGRSDVLAYIREFFDLTDLTTLRDDLSSKILALAGRETILLPCTSLFAVDELGIQPSNGEYVVLNYMPTGGHYTFGQSIDASLWEKRFVSFARDTAKRRRCILVCHDQKELKAAKSLLPEIETFYSTSHADYLRLYAKAAWGLMNRVHGAFALASLGKPAAVVGADSRARMTSVIGLPVTFVNDATPQWLDTQATFLEQKAEVFAPEMAKLKAEALKRYIQLIKTALKHAM